MKLRRLLVVCSVLCAAPALAATDPIAQGLAAAAQTKTGDASGNTVLAPGASAPRSLSVRAADVINVADYSAQCNNSANDSTAINNALSAIKTYLATVSSGHGSSKLVFPSNSLCLITGTLNFTGLSHYGLTVDWSGSTLVCQTNGSPCVDALGSRFIHWYNGTIFGVTSNAPNYGIVIGRTSVASADEFDFSGMTLVGDFTSCGLYNFSSENNVYNHMKIYNTDSGSTAAAVCLDGVNHYNITSTFVTQTLPTNTAQSFKENAFYGGTFQVTGTGPAIWIAGLQHSGFFRAYGSTSGNNPVVLYSVSGVTAIADTLVMDVHFETASNVNTFLITGTNTSGLVNGFTYNDTVNNATTSVFATSGSVTSVILRNVDINIAAMHGTPTLFDTPANYTMTGHVMLPTIASFNAPASWQGRLDIGQLETQALYGTGSFSLQYPDGTAVGGNARGANAVDLQTTRSVNNQVAIGANAVVLGGSGNQASAQYAGVVGGFGNFATGTGSIVAGGTGNTADALGSAVTGGYNATIRSRPLSSCFGGVEFSAPGDNQTCTLNLKGTGSSTSAIRLTSNNAGAGANYCVNIPASTVFGMRVDVYAIDHTTPANSESWMGWNMMLARGATGNATLSTNSTPTPFSTGTVTGSSISATVDTTYQCLNLSFTPPTGNTDTWDVVARVQDGEVQ